MEDLPSKPSQNVKLQNLRDFTVQIRRPSDNAIVGTGVAVSMDGEIITCAHVVRAAGIEPRQHKDAEIIVYFPQLSGGQKKERRARVKTWFPEHDDDIVLLQLTDSSMPLGPEQIAVLGSAEGSEGNPFRSYGFRRIADYQAAFAFGTIMGLVEQPESRNLLGEIVQLHSDTLNRGMSGAPVLDTERNLVIGVVVEKWFPDEAKNAKLYIDEKTGWAIDNNILTKIPFNLKLRDKNSKTSSKLPAPDPQHVVFHPINPKALNGAPSVLPEWVGRQDLLAKINSDYIDPTKHITGLIGFGGEGKSSLARKWLENQLSFFSESRNDLSQRINGIFWWPFYDRPNVDEFFEKALDWITGGLINPNTFPSAGGKAHIIAGFLGTGNYIFVLDGLEIMQHQNGDSYGLLKSIDLRQFLEFFAAPNHHSFCLITSRAPLLDLLPYTTYAQQDVARLSDRDGRDMLIELGVKGRDDQLKKIVHEWDGHALTLSLIGAYLSASSNGKVEDVDKFTLLTSDLENSNKLNSKNQKISHKYEHVHRILRRYDKLLTRAERDFLLLFCTFRTPVKPDAFKKVFLAKGLELTKHFAKRPKDLSKVIKQLIAYRIIRLINAGKYCYYTTHPLIRNYYFAQLTSQKETKDAHHYLKNYYLDLAQDIPQDSALSDLLPLIEVVHHACNSQAYDDAWNIFSERIQKNGEFVLTEKLGARETAVALLEEFFPNKNLQLDPIVNNFNAKTYVLNSYGVQLMSLGQLTQSEQYFRRAIAITMNRYHFFDASRGYQNLSELFVYMGKLQESLYFAKVALFLAEKSQDGNSARVDACCCVAWSYFLMGYITESNQFFKEAQKLEQIITGSIYLYSLNGIHLAEQLVKCGDLELASKALDANLNYLLQSQVTFQISQSYRIMAEIDTILKNNNSALENFRNALQIARKIDEIAILIETLGARGRFYAKTIHDTSASFSDLYEALGYATQSNYRLYEADIRNALAWAYKASGDSSRARLEATHARQMSEEMGYYWGKVDADEVLQALTDAT